VNAVFGNECIATFGFPLISKPTEYLTLEEDTVPKTNQRKLDNNIPSGDQPQQKRMDLRSNLEQNEGP
jgi:hypothetical protein